MIDQPVALLVAFLALILGCLQLRLAREPLSESRYPFVKTKSRPLRVVAALWAWFVALVALAVAF